MITKGRMRKLAFLLISGAFINLVCFSLSSADILFSTDIPVKIGSGSFEERDIIYYESPYFYLRLSCSAVGIPKGVNIDAFACTTHCVGVHQSDQGLDLYAPFGLRDIFAFTLRPNPIQDNRKTHEAKAARALKYWPELTVISWPENS